MEKIRRMMDLLKKLLAVFFGSEDHEDVKEKGKKALSWAAIYRSGQWGLVILAGTIVTALQKFGLEYLGVFTILFVGNTLTTGGVIVLNKKTDIDFTFMEGLRNILREGFEISLFFGCLVEIISFGVLLVWSGADQFIIFFEERFSSRVSKIGTFLLASCCSMAIWTHIYMGFATGFWDLWGKLYG